jgi:serine/threonine protein kinase
VEIYCTRPGCAKPLNSFPELNSGNTLKIATQKFCTHCGMPMILGGRYLPEQPLAKGGFGTTFIARDRYTPAMRRCVVKQLLPTGFSPQQMVVAKAMFEREGAVLEELGRHPNIPDLLAFFPVESGAEEYFYLVQEYIDGLTLEQVVEQTGGLLESEVLEMLESLLPVLQFVHDSGSIHRDIKPSNIMVGRQDTKYYLLDFGAVKQITAAVPGARSTGIFTPGFGAPEQMRGDRVLPATDIYALGVTCIYLLTGKHPEDLFDLQKNQWDWRGQVGSPVSAEFSQVIDRMTANAPSDRYDSAQAVLSALRSAQAQSIQAATPAISTPTPNLAPTPNPVQVSTASSAHVQVQVYPQVTPPKPLVLPPLGSQLVAAFGIGFEAGLLGLFSYHALSVNFGPFSYAIAAGLILVVLWLRVSRTLDNKDLLVFVNGLTLLAAFLVPLIWRFANLPSFFELVLLSAVVGSFVVALSAFARLVYQILYRLL